MHIIGWFERSKAGAAGQGMQALNACKQLTCRRGSGPGSVEGHVTHESHNTDQMTSLSRFASTSTEWHDIWQAVR